MREKLVVNSINSEDNRHCIDFFKRKDGTFGFEEYRRDIEDYNRWFKIGSFDTLFFSTYEDAQNVALTKISWLKSQLNFQN